MSRTPKNEFIRLRVADWEKFWISTKAAKAHMSVSEFVRKAAMDKSIVVLEFSDELMTELRRQGNNLNQLTAMAHMGRIQQIKVTVQVHATQGRFLTANKIARNGLIFCFFAVLV